MTPERLAEIRGIANTDYSVAHEEVLVDTFAGTARMIDALRELLPEYDSAKVYADRRTVEISEREEQIADLVAERKKAEGQIEKLAKHIDDETPGEPLDRDDVAETAILILKLGNEMVAKSRKEIDRLKVIVGRRGEAIDELQSRTARLIEDLKSAEAEIEKLSKFILDEIPFEPSISEGAVDTAIRLLRGSIGFKVEEEKTEQIPGGTFFSPDLDIVRKAADDRVGEYLRLVPGDRIKLDVWGEMDVLIPASAGEGGAVQARPCTPGGLITPVGIGDWVGRNGRKITP